MSDESEGISVDVEAEQQAFSAAISPSEIKAPNNITADKQDLPPSIPYEPTQVNVSTQTKAEVSETKINLQVKFDPEEGYNSLKSTVDGVQETLKDTVNSISNRWIPDPKASSKFEERPTLEQTNLIFDTRKEQFSGLPKWS